MKLITAAFAMTLSSLAVAHQGPNEIKTWGNAKKAAGSLVSCPAHGTD